jgi:hypothetical protein
MGNLLFSSQSRIGYEQLAATDAATTTATTTAPVDKKTPNSRFVFSIVLQLLTVLRGYVRDIML